MQLDALSHPSLHAEKLQARAYFEGHADSEQFAVRFMEHSSLDAQNLQITDMASAQALTLQFAGLSLKGKSNAPYEVQVQSPLNVQIKQLRAEQLHSQDWQLSSSFSGQLPQLKLSSSLTGEHGLKLTSNIELRDNTVQGSASLDSTVLSSGNPLQKKPSPTGQTQSPLTAANCTVKSTSVYPAATRLRSLSISMPVACKAQSTAIS